MDEFDFEPETSAYRYTIEQFVKLNPGRIKLPSDLEEIFSRYQMPECSTKHPYHNVHNKRFHPEGLPKAKPVKKPGFRGSRSDNVFSDSNILPDLRHALSSVVKGADGNELAITQINQKLIPGTQVGQVAELFFDVIMQSPKQMNEYLDVFFRFTQPHRMEKKIYFEFVKLVKNTFVNPRVLPDTPLEAGASRTKKHREATCRLMATLFTYPFSESNPAHAKPREFFANPDNLVTTVIDPLFASYRERPISDTVKNIANVWDILHKSGKWDDILPRYTDEITDIYRNEKGTVRLLLRNYAKS